MVLEMRFRHSFSSPLLVILFHFTFIASCFTVSSTVLVIARDTAAATSGTSGLNAHGIPYEVLIVPQSGAALPTLNSSATVGNYGGIITLSELSYQYTTGWASGLTSAQWQAIYDYQTAFGVRLARLDVYPNLDFGMLSLQPE